MHALISPINLNHMVFVSNFDDEMDDEDAVDMPEDEITSDDGDESDEEETD